MKEQSTPSQGETPSRGVCLATGDRMIRNLDLHMGRGLCKDSSVTGYALNRGE